MPIDQRYFMFDTFYHIAVNKDIKTLLSNLKWKWQIIIILNSYPRTTWRKKIDDFSRISIHTEDILFSSNNNASGRLRNDSKVS